jgi:hypothetical protein
MDHRNYNKPTSTELEPPMEKFRVDCSSIETQPRQYSSHHGLDQLAKWVIQSGGQMSDFIELYDGMAPVIVEIST